MYWRIYIMKKRLLALLFVAVLCLSGCQNEETAKKDALEKAFENRLPRKSFGFAESSLIPSSFDCFGCGV